MYAQAKQLRLPDTVVGFHHHRRMKHIHLVIGDAPHYRTICERVVAVRVPLDGLARLDWTQVCPTCLSGVPGFLDWWRANHQPLPY